MTARVLIDATNLVVGGGIQVASSFLSELIDIRDRRTFLSQYPWLNTLTIEASMEVSRNLRHETRNKLDLTVKTSRPGQFQLSTLPLNQYDLCFTLFGPTYGPRRGRVNIAGFADGTSLWGGHQPVQQPQPTTTKIKRLARSQYSQHWFKSMDRIIVEAQHVKRDLNHLWNIEMSRIDVAQNCVNQELLRGGTSTPDADLILKNPISQKRQGFCYITRNYPHKNIQLLGKIGSHLEAQGITDVSFTLTLTDSEWSALDPITRHYSTNLGPVLITQVRDIYRSSEGAVFPSLLESASATPLEALALDTPLIASDREFVREMCGTAPLYASPQSPQAWGRAIQHLRLPRIREERVRLGREVFREAPNAHDRALQYLESIDRALSSIC